MTAPTSLLDVEHLRVAYGNHVAASDVALHVSPGETVGLLGPNGAGKSTVIHAIIGLVSPQTGRVLVCGEPNTSAPAKRAFGFAPDDLPTPLSLTGAETIALMARLRRGDFDNDFALWLAEHFELGPHLGRAVVGYSHGMRRKLQIVCAVSHHPALLILDEPLRGLDPEAAAILHAILEVHTRSGGGVLLATHDLEAAARTCDRVTIMASGAVVGAGTPDEVCAQAGTLSLEPAFLALSGLSERVDDRRTAIVEKMSTQYRCEEVI
ncbi:ABC transporter ATP-binding protein [Nocardioides sp.]|uniref:ABC transporter ATP-binding protein n=1 Tax=Nocardioides sp. TaxID=35761 RepID=UPI003D0D8BA9